MRPGLSRLTPRIVIIHAEKAKKFEKEKKKVFIFYFLLVGRVGLLRAVLMACSSCRNCGAAIVIEDIMAKIQLYKDKRLKNGPSNYHKGWKDHEKNGNKK